MHGDKAKFSSLEWDCRVTYLVTSLTQKAAKLSDSLKNARLDFLGIGYKEEEF